jgi:hypothetical protein
MAERETANARRSAAPAIIVPFLIFVLLVTVSFTGHDPFFSPLGPDCSGIHSSNGRAPRKGYRWLAGCILPVFSVFLPIHLQFAAIRWHNCVMVVSGKAFQPLREELYLVSQSVGVAVL